MENKGTIPGKTRLREDFDCIFLSQPEIMEPPQPPDPKKQMQIWLGCRVRWLCE
jgi:hypothetical protein